MTEIYNTSLNSIQNKSTEDSVDSKKLLFQWAVQQALNAIHRMQASQTKANQKLRKAEIGEN